jgi:hypothetical protein
MTAFNAILNGLFDLLCWPFRGLPAWVGLVVISLLSGVGLLLLFKVTSPQKAIGRVKDRLWASLHEIRLFKDDFVVLTKAIGRLMKDNVVYLACCLVALGPMLLIVAPILFQLDARYGFEPLRAGDRFVLDVQLAPERDPVASGVELELPDGLSVEQGPVRVPSSGALAWRLRVDREGAHEISLRVDGERFTKRVDAIAGTGKVSPGRYKSTRVMDALMFPIEEPLAPNAPVEAMVVTQARAGMLGMDGDSYPWLIVFCVVGLAFGFALKGVFKVNL